MKADVYTKEILTVIASSFAIFTLHNANAVPVAGVITGDAFSVDFPARVDVRGWESFRWRWIRSEVRSC